VNAVRKRKRRRVVRRLRTFRRPRRLSPVRAPSTMDPRVAIREAPPPRLGERAGPGALVRQLASWPPRRWLVAAGTASAVALLTGTPTDVVPNPLYVRMTPVVWWNYPIWALSAVLAGLVVATYVRAGPTPRARRDGGVAFGGSALSFFAVGCPICNKLVVAALGAGGALSYFGPVQPAIGVASIALLGVALAFRLRALAACSVGPAPAVRSRPAVSR
jgi:hypothetical protein